MNAAGEMSVIHFADKGLSNGLVLFWGPPLKQRSPLLRYVLIHSDLPLNVLHWCSLSSKQACAMDLPLLLIHKQPLYLCTYILHPFHLVQTEEVMNVPDYTNWLPRPLCHRRVSYSNIKDLLGFFVECSSLCFHVMLYILTKKHACCRASKASHCSLSCSHGDSFVTGRRSCKWDHSQPPCFPNDSILLYSANVQ